MKYMCLPHLPLEVETGNIKPGTVQCKCFHSPPWFHLPFPPQCTVIVPVYQPPFFDSQVTIWQTYRSPLLAKVGACLGLFHLMLRSEDPVSSCVLCASWICTSFLLGARTFDSAMPVLLPVFFLASFVGGSLCHEALSFALGQQRSKIPCSPQNKV